MVGETRGYPAHRHRGSQKRGAKLLAVSVEITTRCLPGRKIKTFHELVIFGRSVRGIHNAAIADKFAFIEIFLDREDKPVSLPHLGIEVNLGGKDVGKGINKFGLFAQFGKRGEEGGADLSIHGDEPALQGNVLPGHAIALGRSDQIVRVQGAEMEGTTQQLVVFVQDNGVLVPRPQPLEIKMFTKMRDNKTAGRCRNLAAAQRFCQ